MSISRKLISVNGLIFFGLLIGFLNNVAITGVFGLNREVDAYFAAMLLPQMFMSLVIDYLGKNFLPVYARRYQDSPVEASRLASSIVSSVFLLAILVAALLWFAAEPIYRLLLPGFDAAGVEKVAEVFRIMAPAIVLMSVNQIHQYVHQHDEQYLRVTSANILLPATILLFIIAGHSVLGVQALPIGYLVGHLMVFLAMAWRIPYRYRPRLAWRDESVRSVLRNSGMLMASGTIARTRQLFVAFFASTLGEGAISAIAIARKLCQPLSEATLRGVRMVIFSHSAREAAGQRLERLGELYNFAIAAILLGLVPVSVWLMMDGRMIVETLFLRGEFTPEMAAMVTMALLGLAPSVPLLGINQVMSNCFYALGKVIVPLVVMPIGTLVYLPLAWWFSSQYGLVGLTAASSVMAGGISVALLLFLARELDTLSWVHVLRSITQYLLMAIVAVTVVMFLRDFLPMSGFVELFVTGTMVLGSHFALAWLFRDGTNRRLWRHLREGFSRKEAPAA